MEDIFNWLKMNDFRDVLGSKMSTGMKQKVSIARTIVHDPPVLIFDEPTSGLDVLVARAVLQNILELRDRGKTIVFSTHSMHEVEKLCSRVAIIHKGRVQAEGAPSALLDQFDQPDLEELFFYLVERADSAANEAGTVASAAGELTGAQASFHRARLARSMASSLMRWSNLFVIFRREVRDQIRDRRTLFMIFVLPILLYPILGIGVTKFAVALEQKPRVVIVVGPEYLPKPPGVTQLRLATASIQPFSIPPPKPSGWSCVRNPPRAPGATRGVRERGHPRRGCVGGDGDPPRPAGAIAARERERDRHPDPLQQRGRAQPDHLSAAQRNWWTGGVRASSTAGSSATRRRRAIPSRSRSRRRTSRPRGKSGSVLWSRLFPFLLVMMSLTGAFYPAVDSVRRREGARDDGNPADQSGEPVRDRPGEVSDGHAGERDDRRLEPAEHGADGRPARQPGRVLVGRGGPPVGRRRVVGDRPADLAGRLLDDPALDSPGRFFSAVCVSLAVLARSMKEGQYYMTPLYLVCMPLVFLTLMPGVELDLFYSLVPITGVALLLRALILGNYDVATAVFLAGAGADRGLRGGGAAVGGRPVSARGCLVPRVRAVQPVGLAAAHAARPRAHADRRPGGVVLRPDADARPGF